jgi:hypothetical protein
MHDHSVQIVQEALINGTAISRAAHSAVVRAWCLAVLPRLRTTVLWRLRMQGIVLVGGLLLLLLLLLGCSGLEGREAVPLQQLCGSQIWSHVQAPAWHQVAGTQARWNPGVGVAAVSVQ